MTDWADGIETRNYGIKSEIDARMLSELIRSVFALALVAGALLFYSWIRSQIVNTGYESQSLFAEEESLRRTQKALILEEETLRNPERIDTIARNDLGMTRVRPGQLIQDVETGVADAMAMADSGKMELKRAARLRASGGIPVN